jgi:mannose-6-phosphate isomerase-like protein (cupin superfamily)
MTGHDSARAVATGRAEARVVRYRDLQPCLNAFIDTRSPGSDRKENFTIIGPGVAENPDQHVHITEPHGFNIGGARQPPGCLNSQHSHETAEVFYVHTGRWRFMSGEKARDGEVFLSPGDLISIPTRIFRGFENVGDDAGFLWAVLGGDDPGRVMWAPYVFDMARDFGLVLLDDGSLIDTTKGESVPPDRGPMPVTTQAQVDAMTRADNAMLERIVVRASAARPACEFAAIRGVEQRRLVGEGPIDWPHGFTVSELRLAPGAALPPHRLAVADVWFVQSGEVMAYIDGEPVPCGPGDTITFPAGSRRSVENGRGSAATLVLVRGGDAPPSPSWG